MKQDLRKEIETIISNDQCATAPLIAQILFDRGLVMMKKEATEAVREYFQADNQNWEQLSAKVNQENEAAKFSRIAGLLRQQPNISTEQMREHLLVYGLMTEEESIAEIQKQYQKRERSTEPNAKPFQPNVILQAIIFNSEPRIQAAQFIDYRIGQTDRAVRKFLEDNGNETLTAQFSDHMEKVSNFEQLLLFLNTNAQQPLKGEVLKFGSDEVSVEKIQYIQRGEVVVKRYFLRNV